jgi:hypothetical protein
MSLHIVDDEQRRDRPQPPCALIVNPHLFFRCGSPQQCRDLWVCCFLMLKSGPNATMFTRERFEHAPFHYEFCAPASQWLPEDIRVERCALVRQRILRCRPTRGLYYKDCAGPKPACSYKPTEEI